MHRGGLGAGDGGPRGVAHDRPSRRGDGQLMARTPTHPPTDRSMWRRLLARAHPDAGGTHELFIWAGAVRDVVCGSRLRGGVSPEPEDHPTRRREASTSAAPE